MSSILTTAICVPLSRITQYSSWDRTSFQFLKWCQSLRLRDHTIPPKCARGVWYVMNDVDVLRYRKRIGHRVLDWPIHSSKPGHGTAS